MKKPKRGLLITGTDTDVGKTYVTSLLAQSLVARRVRVGVYKPVASGCRLQNGELVSTDAEQLWTAAGKPRTLHDVSPQRFEAALAPNVAAMLAGTSVNASLLRTGLTAWAEHEFVLVEGVGGLMSPISDTDLVVDLAVEFGYPILVVVKNSLGCINQTLQTLLTAERYGLAVMGIVLNDVQPPDARPRDVQPTDLPPKLQTHDVSRETNRSEIARRTDVPVLAEIAFGQHELDASFIDKLVNDPS